MAEQKYEQYEINSTFPYHLKKVRVDKRDQTITYIHTYDGSDEKYEEIANHVKRFFDATFMEMAESKTVCDAKTSEFQVRYTFQGAAALASWEKIKNYSSYKKYNFQAPNAAIPNLFSTASMPEESGNRSKMHSALYGITSDTIRYEGVDYQLCSRKVNFAQLPSRVVSMGTGREIILLNTENSTTLPQKAQEFLQICPNAGQANRSTLFARMMDYSRSLLKSTEIDAFVTQNVSPIQIDTTQSVSLPVISLGKFVREGLGVCRHHALFTAYVLGYYANKNGLPGVNVVHWRDSWERQSHGKTEQVAHSWVVWREGDKLYIIDSMWNKSFDLTNRQDYETACRAYSNRVINDIFTAFKLKPPEPLSPQRDNQSAETIQLKQEIAQLKANHQAKDQKIKTLEAKQTEDETTKRIYQDQNTRLRQTLNASNDETERLRRQISDQQQDVVLAKTASQEAKELIRQAKEKEDLANLTLGLANILFLSNENRQMLAHWLKTASRDNKQNTLNGLQGISTLFSKAEFDFKGYNQHYIHYVKSLTWWQRILRNHGRTGLYRAMCSKENMTEAFRAIQEKYNTTLSNILKNPSTQAFNQLYTEIHNELIKLAEKQLVDMRSNYFDSSNLNPHSYATYLTRYILNLKNYRLKQNNLEPNENIPDNYEPLFAKKEDIKSSCDQLIAEYKNTHKLKI